mmetsp:Transcript_9136/g.8058  ORF Transcript_9136/g.8058 Transcript_9136/m.8058 type:complete len:103 (-) Transcript_9136:109-417(-)
MLLKNIQILSLILALDFSHILNRGTPPEPRHGHSAAVIGKNIIYYGGRGHGLKIYDTLHILDTQNLLWVHPKTGGTRPPPRYYHKLLPLGNEIMVFGGIRPK